MSSTLSTQICPRKPQAPKDSVRQIRSEIADMLLRLREQIRKAPAGTLRRSDRKTVGQYLRIIADDVSQSR